MNRPDWRLSVSDSFGHISHEIWPKITSNSKSMKFDETSTKLANVETLMEYRKRWPKCRNVEKVTETRKSSKNRGNVENNGDRNIEMTKKWPKPRKVEKWTETSKSRKTRDDERRRNWHRNGDIDRRWWWHRRRVLGIGVLGCGASRLPKPKPTNKGITTTSSSSN